MAENKKIKVRERAYRENGAGEYSGEVVKGTFGFVPQGFGTAVYPASKTAPEIVQDGFFKNGEFVTGKLRYGATLFDGVFSDGCLASGDITYKEDSYRGNFRDNKFILTSLKNTRCFSGNVVLEGEVIGQDIFTSNLGTARHYPKMLVKGVAYSHDGTMYSEGYFLCDTESVNRDLASINKAVVMQDYAPMLVFGQMVKDFGKDGVFRGVRVTGLESTPIRKLIEQTEKRKFKTGEMLTLPKRDKIGDIKPIKVPEDNGAKGFYDRYLPILGEFCGGNYAITGEFSKNNNNDYVSFVACDFEYTSPKWTFKGSNKRKDLTFVLNNEEMAFCGDNFIKGVLTDKVNKVVYDGVFEYETFYNADRAVFAEVPLFRFGKICVTKPTCRENFEVKYGSLCEDKECFKNIKGRIDFGNGDYYDGLFDVEIKPNEPVSRKFTAGKFRKTVDTRDVDNTVTIYTLESVPAGVIQGRKITYSGSIDYDIKTDTRAEKRYESGDFTGDLIKKNLELVRGNISSEITDEKGEYSIEFKKNTQRSGVKLEGERITRNFVIDDDTRVDIICEKGEFDAATQALKCGKIELATKGEREYNLETKDGKIFVGRAWDRLEDMTLEKCGSFVRGGAAEFNMTDGEICFETPKLRYKALFDNHGIDAFDGARFGGVVIDNEGKKRAYITSNLETLLDKESEKTK